MKIENKLIWPFVIFVVSFVLIELIFFNFFTITKENYENIVSVDTRFNNDENILTYYDVIREASFLNYRNSKLQEYLDRYNEYDRKADVLYDRLIENTDNKALRNNYIDKYEIKKRIVAIELGIIEGSIDDDYLKTEEYLQLKKDFDDKRDFPKEFYQLNVKDDMVENISKARFYAIVMLVVLILILGLTVFEFFIIHQDVISPIRKLSKGIRDIGDGKYPILNYEENNEMHDLIRNLNKTTIKLLKTSTKRKQDIDLKEEEADELDAKTKKEKVQINELTKKIKDLQTEIQYLHNMIKLAVVVNKKQKTELNKKN